MPKVEARSVETVLYKLFRHSLVKRSDGNDITIWVHNSFNETLNSQTGGADEASTPVNKRAQSVNVPGNFFYTGHWWQSRSDACGHSSFQSLTSATVGAYTGGVEEMSRWGHRTRGGFELHFQIASTNPLLVVAGSNNGANAGFYAKRNDKPHMERMVGTYDIGDLAQDSLRFAKSFSPNGQGVRTAATGDMNCNANNSGKAGVTWTIRSVNHRA
ncbi:hypothetical protein BN1723_003554 [Verticillium longisporum]|uniref:Uncharacterized protein n=1 Tax=Verticillium longisporum TaxID=100787 RepID=A0A0G4M2F5_VERLO|nr:hypothetical protein BN1723_003554 [Verticillium longisporum]